MSLAANNGSLKKDATEHNPAANDGSLEKDATRPYHQQPWYFELDIFERFSSTMVGQEKNKVNVV